MNNWLNLEESQMAWKHPKEVQAIKERLEADILKLCKSRARESKKTFRGTVR